MSRGKQFPLTLAVHQDDKNLQGIQLFWSFQNQYPSYKDSDGCGNMQKTNIQSFQIDGAHHEGEMLYLAIYTFAAYAKVCLACSFEHQSAIKILNVHLGHEHDDGPTTKKRRAPRLFQPKGDKNTTTLRQFKRDYQDQVSTMIVDKARFKTFRLRVREYKDELQQLEDKQKNLGRWMKLKE